MWLMAIFLLSQATMSPAAVPLSREPDILNQSTIVLVDDYPQEALREGKAGIVTVALAISTDGKVTGCQVVETSGASSLDTTTCRIAMKRGKFAPATNAAGEPVAGIYHLAMSWGVDKNQPRVTVDLGLTVGKLPSGYTNPARLRAVFDATGHIVSCAVATSSGNASADAVACRQSIAQIVIAPPKAAKGITPVAVRYPIVSFVVQ